MNDQADDRPLSGMDRLTTILEKLTLVLVTLMTFSAIVFELIIIYKQGVVQIADILLLFLYAEVLSMVRVYYTRAQSAFIYPILIAITALSRLIVLQGKDMEAQSLLFEAAAVLILALAIVLLRVRDISEFVQKTVASGTQRAKDQDGHQDP